jgi:hypothetical protein
MGQSANVQPVHRFQNHRNEDLTRSAVLSAEKFAPRASNWEAELQPLPYLMFADSLNFS